MLDADSLDALSKTITAFAELVRVLGVGPFVALVVFFALLGIGYIMYRDYRSDAAMRVVVEEKEKEIVRLSAVGRELRNQLLRIKGVPEQVLRADADDSAKARERGAKK